MPKDEKQYSHYATRNGREGPRIYTSWPECDKNTKGVPGVEYDGFYSLEAAERYLARGARLKAIRRALSENGPLSNVSNVAVKANALTREKESTVQVVEVKAEIKEEVMVDHVQEVCATISVVAKSLKAEDVGDVARAVEPIVNSETVTVKEGDAKPSQEAQPAPKTHWTCCDPQPEKAEPAEGQAPVSDPEAPPPILLSDEQLHILDLVRSGQNVFFTGSAGTGKSVLIRAIIGLWPKGCRRLAITASTGAASVAFPGGRTVHSWASIGLGTKDADLLIQEIMCDKTQRRRWQQTDCLLIDEISMIDGELFDKLEFMARVIRADPRPFGGIQLVISGDFFQLPPVPGPSKVKTTFAFEARSWSRCFDTTHKLTRVFRQSDEEFVSMLNEMRLGKVSAKTEAEFKYLERDVKYYDDIGPTELFPLKAHVERANQMHLDSIDNPPVTFYSFDVGGVDERNRRISLERQREILKSVGAQEVLILKKGAQVMLIMNKVQGVLVNGSVGVVEDFRTIREAEKEGIAPFCEADPNTLQRVKDGLPTIVRDPNSGWMDYRYPLENRQGNLMAGRTQVPLILAWALSVHKSQGATLERVKVDLARTFERGQAYVALSRATSMDTLQVLNFDASKVEAHPHVLQWMGHEADERDLEDENYQRAQAEADYRRRMEEPEEDYFAHVDDIDEIDIHLMDCEHIPI